MKLDDLVPKMRKLGVDAATFDADGNLLGCHLLEYAPVDEPLDTTPTDVPEPPDTPEQRHKRETAIREEYEQLLYAHSTP